jgi:hypothetical protein
MQERAEQASRPTREAIRSQLRARLAARDDVNWAYARENLGDFGAYVNAIAAIIDQSV